MKAKLMMMGVAAALATGAMAEEDPGGVQLWENGPYWAECNVGATKPEEYGYYFWWGDTVGYTRSGGTWVSSTGQQMSNSPFVDSVSSCPTFGRILQGYIDGTGNLAAAHDAATAHLGSPWRMPTSGEIQALVAKCTTTWITTNGVYGRLVTGKGAYADRSIFLPAAGEGFYSDFHSPGSLGCYWSSTPYFDESQSVDDNHYAWGLYFLSSNSSECDYEYRFAGQSVRPVRDLPPPVTGTQTTPVPVPYAWLTEHVPGVADGSEAYDAAAKATAANGRPVWACYALGLDPQNAMNDFRIASFPMKADLTPDFANVAFDPPREQWNVPDAPVTWKGAAKLEGPWMTVSVEGGSSGTARPAIQFFKAVVFGDADDDLGGVQLWENGPYWAECNVGATKPEEYGCYFWWGDTVGYTRSGGAWNDNGNGDGSGYYGAVTWVSSTGEQMSSSPFDWDSCPTMDKSNAALQSAGYIDSTGNLVAAHDAATAHLGAPWRMPTSDEIQALEDNCTTTWITTNGVPGRLVTGKGAYANRSIFLPAAGNGDYSDLYYPGSYGFYWSSTPTSDNSLYAWYLDFHSSGFYWDLDDSRYSGQSVRPVRGFAE